MHILIMSMEAGRFGPARLPEALAAHDVTVSILCPADNLLTASRFIARHFPLPRAHSIRILARAVSHAVLAGRVDFIVPGDEQAVILLQTLARDAGGRHLEPQVQRIVAGSLGDPAHFDASLFKSETMKLARSLGLAVPAGGTVTDREEARALASRLGYPVYIKASFSWAGLGVTRCDDEEQLLRAFPTPRGGQKARRWVRHLLGRDWFPVDTQIDVQAAIAGECGMYCGVAWHGHMLGGYGARKIELVYPNGPSRSLHLQHHQQMAAMAERMIEAMGFTGFFSFDFILPADGTDPVLIECNPRLVPISHLGYRIGVDQAGLLVARMRGCRPAPRPIVAKKALDVLLFPHSLSARADERALLKDIPGNDAGLVNYLTRQRARS